ISSAEDGGSPKWFTLLCQRAHPFDLKGDAKNRWVCLDAQGSLSATGTAQVYVNRDSPVGRFFDTKLEWGRVYLLDLLIRKMDVEGRRSLVVIDSTSLPGRTPLR